MRRMGSWGVAVVAVLTLGTAACSESEPDSSDATTASEGTSATDGAVTGTDVPVTDTNVDDGSIVAGFAGQEWFAGTVPDGAVPADESLEPVIIGMINMENSPVGSFPELRAAAKAAFEWVNTELGGVGGRPVELRTCITSFSVEQSQACAQELVQSGAVVVMSGIDVTANGSIPVLEQNGVPLVGGIPATLAEMRSDDAFFFSGGVAGAYVAFAKDAADSGASKIAFAYGDFDSFKVPAEDYGAKVATDLGLDVELIPFPITTTDFLPVVTRAIDSGADAIAVGAADTACVPLITTLADLGYDGRVYLVGACAAGEILEQVPDDIQAPVIFNSEGPVVETAEGQMFEAVTDRYADEPAGGAGTVAFRSAMNVWALLSGLEGELTPAAARSALADSRDVASFWGHPYTCAEDQVPGLPALCAPQQVLFRVPTDADGPQPESDGWIDVPALLQG